MINSRRKGIDFEQLICRVLRDRGYTAKSSREMSRYMDNVQKVDILTNAPFNIQCKRTEKLRPIDELIRLMPDSKTRIVISKRNNKPAVASMLMSDFEKLLLKKKLPV